MGRAHARRLVRHRRRRDPGRPARGAAALLRRAQPDRTGQPGLPRATCSRAARPQRPGRRRVDESLDRLLRGETPPLRGCCWSPGADPNDNDSLYHSLDPADGACTRLLLEHGANVPGTNALAHALDYDRPERVRLLLEHGGDPNESPEWPAAAPRRDPGTVARRHAPARRVRRRRRGTRPPRAHCVSACAPARARRLADDAARARCPRRRLTAADLALNAISTGGPSRGRARRRRARRPDRARDERPSHALAGHRRGGRRTSALAGAAGPAARCSTKRPGSAAPTRRASARARRGPEARVESEYATPLGWAAVGSRYSPDHPDDSFAATNGDWVAVARLLVAAGARVEAKFVDMAVRHSPTGWPASELVSYFRPESGSSAETSVRLASGT